MAQTAPLRIGTRGSKLALWQANAARDALVNAHGLAPDSIQIVPIKTSGDRIRDRPLAEAGGKGLFTREIEAALREGRVDIAVHSAKDMETLLPDGLVIGACLEREDVRDALISRHNGGLDALPERATIGSASVRREALLRRLRPDLRMELLRGNVPTRLARVEAGDFDATLLAAAGLKRLGLEKHISALLPLDAFPPACGQGAIAVECRADDARARNLLAAIDHRPTARALAAERAFLAALDGSCRSPIAGHARMEKSELLFDGIILSHDGREFYEVGRRGNPADAKKIGREAGEHLRSQAPQEFLEALGIL
jgi:hydroxymethylbilane synthase